MRRSHTSSNSKPISFLRKLTIRGRRRSWRGSNWSKSNGTRNLSFRYVQIGWDSNKLASQPSPIARFNACSPYILNASSYLRNPSHKSHCRPPEWSKTYPFVPGLRPGFRMMRPICCTSERAFCRGSKSASIWNRDSSIPSISLNWWIQKIADSFSGSGTFFFSLGSLSSSENPSWIAI